MENITVGQAGILAVLGYAVVFFGLILLMVLIMIIGKIFITAAKRKAATAAEPAAPATPAPALVTAPGTAGQFKLNGVDPKTAAMAMAIVADTMGKPINELRFISIKEVSE